MPKTALKYNGKGFFPGIPAKDLTEEEVKQFGGEAFLLDIGIYEKTTASKTEAEEPETEAAPKIAKYKPKTKRP